MMDELFLLLGTASFLLWDFGVLEVKLKNRLLEDPNAVAIGVLHRHQHLADNDHGHHKNQRQHQQYPKKPHKLPKLVGPKGHGEIAEATRPISFDAERQQVMDAMELPSPTRSVIQKVVQHTRENKRKQLAELPPVAGAFKKRGAPQSLLPRAYQRNELPIMIESRAGGNTLRWTQNITDIDFSKYFPLFLEGLTEKAHPYSFLAKEGAFQLLQIGKLHPEKVVECLHRVIPAIRIALDTHESKYIRDALTILQELTRTPNIGPLLVPYYRQLLPVLNMFKNKRRNLGDDMDFQQHKAKDIGEMIVDTLEILEQTGGPDAYVNIKYMVPTYEGVRN
uniref:Uncharacterized protein n=1 Tax=Globisporangium ultimum (strain ATCC 200006 / CBS 805.95 / DAOM BR144) TaxID=431595 RepID=K3WW12_GLOUD